jgi:hypothetical protein
MRMTFFPSVVRRAFSSGLLIVSASTVGACSRPEPIADSMVVLTWTRDGGLAGFCDELTVTASGDAAASSCTAPGTKRRKLSDAELARLNEWRAQFGPVTATSRDAATADAMTMNMTLSGNGPKQPSDAERLELFGWAQRVHQQTR